MRNYFFFHNLDTCIGCCACQVACKDRHNLSPGEFFRRVDKVRLPVTGQFRFYSAACCHCENPACAAACPNGAFYKSGDGAGLHDDGRCIGSGRCVWNCPYGAVSLSPDRGVAAKCDGCAELRKRGREPACVAACVNRSLQFGRTDGRCDEERLSRTITGQLPDPELTGPSIRIHFSGQQSSGMEV